jgi:hypothetical protein
VVSILPELQPKTNSVVVHLTVAGTSRAAAVDLVKRLEQSPSFRDARITQESEEREKDNPDTVKFQVTALYVPGAAALPGSRIVETKVAETQGGTR